MSLLNDLGTGFAVALTPGNIAFCFLGVLLGTVIGMLPGMGSASGVAILLPLTLGLEPVTALIMLAGLYYGCEYGGTISSVLIRTPGEGASLVTVFDGYPMARQGKAGKALGIAAISSFVAGTGSIVALSITAPLFASVALEFGPPEMFALMVLGLFTVAGVIAGSRRKGIAMALLGALLAMVGLDSQTGLQRFTFGEIALFSGVSTVAIIIGVVALAELLHASAGEHPAPMRTGFREMLITRQDISETKGAMARGGIIGYLLGILPGAGPTLATFFAYDVERRVAKDKSRFGKGDPRGVAAPEAANNAAVNGAFVPTLTLGIPGSATTAILLGAFVLFDVTPGPLLFDDEPELVWGLIASFYVGNVLLLILNLPLAPVFASMLRLKYAYLYPLVIAIAMVGVYAAHKRSFDLFLALGAGAFGYFMKKYGYPVAPLILGLILGGMMEGELRRSLAMNAGSPSIFLERPIVLVLFGVMATILFASWWMGRRRAKMVAALVALNDGEPEPTDRRGAR